MAKGDLDIGVKVKKTEGIEEYKAFDWSTLVFNLLVHAKSLDE